MSSREIKEPKVSGIEQTRKREGEVKEKMGTGFLRFLQAPERLFLSEGVLGSDLYCKGSPKCYVESRLKGNQK